MQIEFTDNQKRAQIDAFKDIIERRLRVSVDDLDAEMIVNELKDSIGVDAYNKGVSDAQTYMAAKLADMGIDVYAEPAQARPIRGQVARKPGR